MIGGRSHRQASGLSHEKSVYRCISNDTCGLGGLVVCCEAFYVSTFSYAIWLFHVMLNNEIVIFAELRCLLPPHETKRLSLIPIFLFTVLKPWRPCKRQCKEGNRTTWVYRECFLAIWAKIFFGFLSCRLPVVAVGSIGPTASSLLVEVKRGEQGECRSPPKKTAFSGSLSRTHFILLP